MNDEELKRLWCEQKLDPAKLSPGDQVNLMRIKLRCLDRAYLWADATIIGIGGACILFFAWTFLKTPLLGARIGLGIIIASLAFDIWKPIRARRMSPQPPADAPVSQWLRHELEKVHAESELKRTMLWSYLLPFWIGGLVFTWGLDIDLSSRIFFFLGPDGDKRAHLRGHAETQSIHRAESLPAVERRIGVVVKIAHPRMTLPMGRNPAEINH